MSKITPKTLSGFMELLPNEQLLFNKIKQVIENNFKSYGFLPIDTPVMESNDVLLAKAGGETEKQIYGVFNGAQNEKSKASLRFDLTVPLAKYVALNFNNLAFPFKRYQIGKVYRGERPQKGRFREFYQCDIDIIGNEKLSVLNDAEMPSVIYSIFKELNIGDFVIKISNRKILKGFFEELGLTQNSANILRIIDKFEKIGQEKVKLMLEEELENNTLIEQILNLVSITGSSNQIVSSLESLSIQNATFLEGVSELKAVTNQMQLLGMPAESFEIDLKITRGLDYYTGTVYETFLKDFPKIGSISSGGRYDNLAGFYTDKKLPGVGISIGLTRLFDQLVKNELITNSQTSNTQVLILPMVENLSECTALAKHLRDNGISTEIYLEQSKFKKKMSYADKLNIPYVVIIGEDEIAGNYYSVKDMNARVQTQANKQEILNLIKK